MSRIEGLSDAVFGFALTLLVVSLEVPTTFDSLATTMLGLPAFAITLLILIWFAHYRFFRRYGLEDSRTIVLNVVLLFVVLFYIYPLKFLFQTILGMTMGLVGWKLDIAWSAPIGRSSLAAIRPEQWPAMMCIYAFGWSLLYGVSALMQAHALSRRVDLGLDPMRLARGKRALRADVALPADGVAVAVAGA